MQLKISKLELIIISGTLFLLLGCGGGGGGSSTTEPPVTNASASGIWQGFFTSNVTKETIALIGIITEDNEVRFISGAGAQYAGSLSITGTTLSGTLIAYAPIGYVFPNGSTIGNVTFTGTVTTKGSLTGTYSGAGDAGSFALAYCL